MSGLDPQTSALVTQLGDHDPAVRVIAAFQLGGRAERESLAALIEALGDENSEVRAIAAQSLAVLGETATLPLLVRLVAADPGIEVSSLTWAVYRLAASAPPDLAGPAMAEVERLRQRASEAVRAQLELLDAAAASGLEAGDAG